MNLSQVLTSTAAKHAHKDAIVFEGMPYTFQDVFENVDRSASLLKRLGVKKGDRVAIQLPKSMEFIFLHLANLSIGGITLPLNTAYKGKEIEYFLRDSGSLLFVTDERNYLELKSLIDGFTDLNCLLIDGAQTGAPFYWEEMEKIVEAELLDYCAQDDDVAIICYTSGTTGSPKGAMITHRNLVDNMRSLEAAWQWTERDLLLHVLPIFHVHGLEVALHGGLNAGSTIIMHEKFEPARVWRTVSEKHCTMLMGVPTMYHRLLNQWEDLPQKPDIASIRVFISGSAPLSENLFEQFHLATGHRILERYGMTETGMITSNPIEAGARKAGSAGYPLPGVEIRVIGADGKDVKPGDVGEVCIKGSNVFKGYWQNPVKTDASFMGPWLKSGDLGYQDPRDHMRLYLVGRSKEIIITGGYNVYPKEIENVIDRHAGVMESAVIGLADDDFGESVTAVVVPKESAAQLGEAEIIEFCKETLAGYKCPKKVYFCRQLPRNAMGKIQKNLLVERYKGLHPSAG
ncbi:MAG: AMP-binding protein [Desulfobacteraceae bacterium]|jgi:malonyl-CoA/methylmalonyl-CoA synthetase